MTDETLPVAVSDDAIDASTEAYLRADNILESINANLPDGKKLLPIPKEYVFKKRDREIVSAAFHGAFELAGGLPRFVAWAHQNPTQFYSLYAKLLPSETQSGVNTNITIVSAIPEIPSDRTTIDECGKAAVAEFTEVDDFDDPE
jgi:hypothetical protein